MPVTCDHPPTLHIIFRARVTVDGSRRRPIHRHYRPNFVIDGRYQMAQLLGPEGLVLLHGHTYEVEMHGIMDESAGLAPGKPFEWREGPNKVATGTVLEILRTYPSEP